MIPLLLPTLLPAALAQTAAAPPTPVQNARVETRAT